MTSETPVKMPYQSDSAAGSSVEHCSATQETVRRFLCVGCRVAVFLCTPCDRGQRYCSVACARSARRRSNRESDCRYQRTERGRLKHAERSRRYRQQRRSVTEHSSVVTPEHDVGGTSGASRQSTAASDEESVSTLTSASTTDESASPHQVKCHFCHRWCDLWVRHTPRRHRIFGHRRGVRRSGRPGPQPEFARYTRF